MTPNDVIASGYRMAKALLHRMTDDLTPDEFRHQPCAGANSAAWVVGHLAATLHQTARRMGAPGLPSIPADFAGRFAKTGKPAEAQSEPGDPAEMLRILDASLDAIIGGVRALPAEKFDEPSSVFALAGTFGELLQFGSLHLSMHVGQLSTIRRTLGKPPVV
ncbi:MAG TPA: DinB family protein [Gemmataceae bacterium]|nr:DinB family protein [Gemmataceae bacterium]